MFCKCGCGQITKIARVTSMRAHTVKDQHLRFLHGHNARSNHPMLGRKHSEETRKKLKKSHQGLRPWMIGKGHSEETREKMSVSHKGIPLPEKTCKNIGLSSKRTWAMKTEEERGRWRKAISEGEKGKFVSEKTRLNISKAKKGKRPSPRTEFTSEILKMRYQDPAYIEKMKKAWNLKPNKAEIFLMDLLNRLYPGEWRYTGDFSMTINGKCPDFVNSNGKKLIIEYFGDHWHQGHDPKEREAAFSPFGYKTLIIWGREMKDLGKVISRIQEFVRG